MTSKLQMLSIICVEQRKKVHKTIQRDDKDVKTI